MIPSSGNRVIYKGNGQTREFGYSFKIFNATDIKVLLVKQDGTRKILTSDYYVDVNASKVYYPGYAPGASEPGADTPPNLQNGETLVVYREVPINQLDKMPDQWPFDTNEKMHDKSCVIDQQLADGVARSLKFDVDLAAGFNLNLPIKAGYGWRVSDDGKSIVELENPKRVYEDTVSVYYRAVADTTSIKSQTEAIKNQAVADITAIKNTVNNLKNDTINVYNNAVSETTNIKEQATADIRNVYNQAVADTTAIKNQAQAISDNSQQYAILARQWAESETAPAGIIGSKSSKTWAEQTASYLDEAINMKHYAEALAEQVRVWNDATTYSVGDIVMIADGTTYRCLQANKGEFPTESYKWTKTYAVSSDTFEFDANGDVNVTLPATSSDQWEIDASGDVMIKAV